MDLPSTLNATRIVYLGKQPYWVRALSLEGLGIILAWLDDVLPGRSDRKMPPAMGDEESQKALDSIMGRWILTWLALRDQGIDFAQAGELSDRATDLERLRVLEVLFAKRRTGEPDPSAKDISATWCTKGMARVAEAIGFGELLKLSTDQFAWLVTDGMLDDDPSFSAEALALRLRDWERDELPKVLAFQKAQEQAGLEVVGNAD